MVGIANGVVGGGSVGGLSLGWSKKTEGECMDRGILYLWRFGGHYWHITW